MVAAHAIVPELGGLPAQARRAIAHDNGGEFARHETVTARAAMPACYCDPHNPWQRGGIGNANGRRRRELPRNANLGGYTVADIDDVIWTFNATPRKRLGCGTPIGAFVRNPGVALEM